MKRVNENNSMFKRIIAKKSGRINNILVFSNGVF